MHICTCATIRNGSLIAHQHRFTRARPKSSQAHFVALLLGAFKPFFAAGFATAFSEALGGAGFSFFGVAPLS